MGYLRSFVIGSSILVVLPHFLMIYYNKHYRPEREVSFDYNAYSMIAPIYFGLMSMLALYLGRTFELDLRSRLFLISIISASFVISLAYTWSSQYYQPYMGYDTAGWARYGLVNGSMHLIVYNIIIYLLEMNV